jgi:predicted nucleotidyltransferase
MGQFPFNISKSKTRASVLRIFFNDPEKEYYLRQLESLTGYSVGNIRREVLALEAGGFLHARYLGKIRLYKLNTSYPLYNEIKGIVRKTVGIEGILASAFEPLEGVDFAFIYGSFAEGRERSSSDIDLLIIGDVRAKKVASLLYEQQSEIGREINSAVYSKEEYIKKLRQKNHFISAVTLAKKIFVKGGADEFRRFTQVRKAREA